MRVSWLSLCLLAIHVCVSASSLAQSSDFQTGTIIDVETLSPQSSPNAGGADAPLTQAALESHIEDWLKETFRVEVEFEVAEALAKLERLKLLHREGDKVAVLRLDQALQALDRTWGEFFPVPDAAAQ